ncbi:MAG: lactate utilization protein [Lachnospiraceae bacterium]
MNQHKKTFYKNQAESIIHKLKARKMDGYYCDTITEAEKKVLELIGEPGKSVGYGGSMTIDDSDLKSKIAAAGHDLIEREKLNQTSEGEAECKSRLINADTFLMSTNAITLDGELINIDGIGNRVAFLIYGPKQVIVIAGMNKVVANVEDGIRRVRNFASPPNTVRLNCDTPCAVTGQCADCLTNSICCQIVTTRVSRIPGRIKVILVGEALGY